MKGVLNKMEARKEYVVNFSQDEINKLEEAVDCINFLRDNFDNSVCEIDDDGYVFNIRTLDYLFDQVQCALENLSYFVNEHCKNC